MPGQSTSPQLSTPGTPEAQIQASSPDAFPGTPHADSHSVLYGMGPTLDDPSSPSPATTHWAPRAPSHEALEGMLVRARKMQQQMNELVADLERYVGQRGQ